MRKQHPPDTLDHMLADFYTKDIPQNYRSNWRAAVQREELSPMSKPMRRHPVLRTVIPIAASFLLVIGAITAGNLVPKTVKDFSNVSTSTSESTYDQQPAEPIYEQQASPVNFGMEATVDYTRRSLGYQRPESASSPAAGEDTTDASSAMVTTPKQLVRTADLTIASTKYDEDLASIRALTTRFGGYVESLSLETYANRVAYYNVRIPGANLDAFLDGVGGIGRITSRSETTTDMTTQYSDTALRKKTQMDKMARLQALMLKAENVTELLEIENQIADTQYDLDRMESTLRDIDRQVDLSAVSLTIREQKAKETVQTSELNLGQRLSSAIVVSLQGLSEFLQNLLVFLAMSLPFLLSCALLGGVAVFFVHRRRKKKLPDAVACPETPDEQDPQESVKK